MLNCCGMGVGVGTGTGGRCGVEFTIATEGEIPDIGVPLGFGDTTILTAVGSGVGAGVELLIPGVDTTLKGAADVVKVPVIADDFGTTSTLVPALFLTQSSISGSR